MPGAHTAGMAQLRTDLGELALTTTLLSIYLSARGADRTLGMLQSALGPFGRPSGP